MSLANALDSLKAQLQEQGITSVVPGIDKRRDTTYCTLAPANTTHTNYTNTKRRVTALIECLVELALDIDADNALVLLVDRLATDLVPDDTLLRVEVQSTQFGLVSGRRGVNIVFTIVYLQDR